MDAELLTMVNNNVYMQARMTAEESRAKNWRALLTFPNIKATRPLEDRMDQDGQLDYQSIQDEVSSFAFFWSVSKID